MMTVMWWRGRRIISISTQPHPLPPPTYRWALGAAAATTGKNSCNIKDHTHRHTHRVINTGKNGTYCLQVGREVGLTASSHWLGEEALPHTWKTRFLGQPAGEEGEGSDCTASDSRATSHWHTIKGPIELDTDSTHSDWCQQLQTENQVYAALQQHLDAGWTQLTGEEGGKVVWKLFCQYRRAPIEYKSPTSSWRHSTVTLSLVQWRQNNCLNSPIRQ